VALATVAGLVWLLRMTQMPLQSYKGTLPALSREQSELADRLSANVKCLSVTIGERSLPKAGSLEVTSEYIGGILRQAGYTVTEHTYSVAGRAVRNIETRLVGSESANGTVVLGAHYDSLEGTVGANDNATGVAAVVELARLLQGSNYAELSVSRFSSMKNHHTSKRTAWEAGSTRVSYAMTVFQCPR
jgi:hypothetical protein